MGTKLLVEDEEQRQYQDAFEIKKYIHLEKYDKAVMAALILKAEVVDENRLNVVERKRSERRKPEIPCGC